MGYGEGTAVAPSAHAAENCVKRPIRDEAYQPLRPKANCSNSGEEVTNLEEGTSVPGRLERMGHRRRRLASAES